MDYFNILSLKQEPFSNSPDPEFFFHSREHLECLQKLELSLLLRRGLNVIIGDVGTGKTTLCRQLIRRFTKREEINTHLILETGQQRVANQRTNQTVPLQARCR
jgi:general secretion pathway protein A